MKLESTGILISLRPFSSRDAIAYIFTYDFGLMVGMLRGAACGVRNKPLTGQIGVVSWNARLDSQLGVFHWEAERNLAAPVMLDAKKLAFMNSAFDLISVLLPERAQYADLYNETLDLLNALGNGGGADMYLKWEINLLRELGYALDLSHCSGCGRCENLNWLSPRTGRAVCDECAAPYINKLYKLPLNLDVTRRFLDLICVQQGADVPRARSMIRGQNI